jgi:hypothetical protein
MRRRSLKKYANPKRTGERSEAAFLHKASSMGFGVAKPWGDSERYDFILDNGRRLLRVQVKAIASVFNGGYQTSATYSRDSREAAYRPKDIDFLVAHVIPHDAWYVLPVLVCTESPNLRFYPHREAKAMRLEQYRDAWDLMKSKEMRSPDVPRRLS